MREDEIVSEQLRRRAWVWENGEVCWNGDDIESALQEIADAGLVVLGFDIIEGRSGGRKKPRGTSGYDIDPLLRSGAWTDCVTLARDLAIRDVRDTQRLTGEKPPYSDLWYCVVTVDQLGIRKLEGGAIFVRGTREGEKRRKRSHLRPL
jgi:hypothetical protein